MPEPRCPDCDLLWTRRNDGSWGCHNCGQIRHDTPEVVNRILAAFRPSPKPPKPEPKHRIQALPPQEEGLF